MTFLALDTSGTFCVLVLAEDDGNVRAVSLFESKRSLSRRLLGEVDGLLTRNGLALADMTAFAVGLGPGSFTGVRVGVTTAKTLAQVLEKPLVGVGTLDAYAEALSALNGVVLPVLPSRRGKSTRRSTSAAFAPKRRLRRLMRRLVSARMPCCAAIPG